MKTYGYEIELDSLGILLSTDFKFITINKTEAIFSIYRNIGEEKKKIWNITRDTNSSVLEDFTSAKEIKNLSSFEEDNSIYNVELVTDNYLTYMEDNPYDCLNSADVFFEWLALKEWNPVGSIGWYTQCVIPERSPFLLHSKEINGVIYELFINPIENYQFLSFVCNDLKGITSLSMLPQITFGIGKDEDKKTLSRLMTTTWGYRFDASKNGNWKNPLNNIFKYSQVNIDVHHNVKQNSKSLMPFSPQSKLEYEALMVKNELKEFNNYFFDVELLKLMIGCGFIHSDEQQYMKAWFTMMPRYPVKNMVESLKNIPQHSLNSVKEYIALCFEERFLKKSPFDPITINREHELLNEYNIVNLFRDYKKYVNIDITLDSVFTNIKKDSDIRTLASKLRFLKKPETWKDKIDNWDDFNISVFKMADNIQNKDLLSPPAFTLINDYTSIGMFKTDPKFQYLFEWRSCRHALEESLQINKSCWTSDAKEWLGWQIERCFMNDSYPPVPKSISLGL
jgi:hypothetical protein